MRDTTITVLTELLAINGRASHEIISAWTTGMGWILSRGTKQVSPYPDPGQRWQTPPVLKIDAGTNHPRFAIWT